MSRLSSALLAVIGICSIYVAIFSNMYGLGYGIAGGVGAIIGLLLTAGSVSCVIGLIGGAISQGAFKNTFVYSLFVTVPLVTFFYSFGVLAG